ncbi:MAG: ankyrin repeat domain-containing protein [Meiothermus sp.]|nr:ankyrin repeat domain-containing protein [Meiothermus sp.]
MRAVLLGMLTLLATVQAQIPPSPAELRAYQGLMAAVAQNDLEEVGRLVGGGVPLEARDERGRTPLLVAAHLGHHQIARALLRAGADPNALDRQRYDLITIAAVRDDVEMIRVGLEGGSSPRNITSPYDGTALIAAAHLGHLEVVRALIAAKAPLDHVNNLGWTALIEAIVLGDGGPRHTAVVRALVEAGANVNLGDRSRTSPLALAKQRRFAEMALILEQAGAR